MMINTVQQLGQISLCFYMRSISIGASFHRERGQWAVYYSSPQSFIIISYSLPQQLWGLWWILIGWAITLSFQPLVLFYRKGNFVYHWGWTSIYRSLSYPFRSLIFLVLYLWFLYDLVFLLKIWPKFRRSYSKYNKILFNKRTFKVAFDKL